MSRLSIRAICAASIATPLLVLGGGWAGAGGNGAVTFTQADHGVVDVFEDANPCTGDSGIVSAVENQVFHGTTNEAGSWFTGTVEGRFTFTPDDATKPSYTGHFATWFGSGDNLSSNVDHSTFNVNAIGSDGSHLQFHYNAQATVNANGTVTVSFEHASCGG